MGVDFRGPYADFLQFGLVPMCLCLPFFLGEIVLVLSVVKNSTDRRCGRRYNLNEVEPRIAGECLCFAKRYDTELPFVLIDQTNWRDSNSVVAAKFVIIACVTAKRSSDLLTPVFCWRRIVRLWFLSPY